MIEQNIIGLLVIVFALLSVGWLFTYMIFEYKPKKIKICRFLHIIIVATTFALIAVLIVNGSSQKEIITTEYPIFEATCPYGKYIFEGEGEIHLFFGSGSGYIEFGDVEKYVVKYWVGNQLFTKVFDAESNPLIVDGKFCIEKIDTWTNYYWCGEYQDSTLKSTTWRIHLPFVTPTEYTGGETN